MQNLIVLGLIPGTQLQITFIMWLVGATAIMLAAMLQLLRTTRKLREWVIAIAWLRITRRGQLA